MKAEELRIGNFVKNKLSSTVIVDGITPCGINPYNKNYEDTMSWEYEFEKDGDCKLIFPLPITEEWLLRFGFTKVPDGTFEQRFDYKYRGVTNSASLTILWNEENTPCSLIKTNPYQERPDIDQFCTLRDIQHIHQLQNLFFALTGEELTIKP